MVKPMSAIKTELVIEQSFKMHNVQVETQEHVLGRFSSGAQLEMMVMAPFMIPEAPKPATAPAPGMWGSHKRCSRRL